MVVALVGSEAFARGSSGGGGRSSGGGFSSRSSSSSSSSFKSSSSSSSWGSTKSTPAKPAATVQSNSKSATVDNSTRQTTKPSAFGNSKAVATGAAVGAGVAVASTPAPTKPVAVSTNKADAKMSKIAAQKNNEAGKKYGSKAQAEKAYATELASKNKYNSATPPSTRPEYIPQSTTVGGRTVNVTYNQLPGGGYGYGYYDPMTSAFVGMAAANMMVNSAMLANHGYGTYSHTGAPVVVHTGPSVFGMIFSILMIGLVIVFLVFLIKSTRD